MNCDAVLSEFINGIHNFINILHLVGPILLVLALAINFGKGVLNPEAYDKKGSKYYINSIIAAVVLFMLPYIVTVSVNIIDPDGNFSVTSCWKLAEYNSKSTSPGYQTTKDDKKREEVLNGTKNCDKDGDGKVDNHEARDCIDD